MKIGVIGYGSIGKRHISNLIALGYFNIILFREKESGNEHGLKELVDFNEFICNQFDFILLSNPTSMHFKYLKLLISANQNILVEKPIVNNLSEVEELKFILRDYAGIGMVAYNTRFHPCISKVSEFINSDLIGRPLHAHFFIGQYLPDWRPTINYINSVSAKRNLGGGVASELIHEIDLALEYFGEPKGQVHSIIAKVSDLQIETEDTADYLYFSKEGVVVSIHTDYLYHGYKRSFEIIGTKANLICDLHAARITIVGKGNEIFTKAEFTTFQRNDMYRSMVKYYIQCLESKVIPEPSLHDGIVSVKIVEEAKIKNNI